MHALYVVCATLALSSYASSNASSYAWGQTAPGPDESPIPEASEPEATAPAPTTDAESDVDDPDDGTETPSGPDPVDPPPVADPAEGDDPSEEGSEDGAAAESPFTGKIYGYIDAFAEKVAATPVGVDDNGNTLKERNAHEFDVANLKVMAQGRLYGRFNFYLVLAGDGSGSPLADEPISVRNAWVDIPIYRSLLIARAGKLYRRFGLYNELLDAVPTFIGIEPPEMFDGDHLLLTRTTNLMLHGSVSSEQATLGYAITTGNDEREGDEIPIGFDIRVDVGSKVLFGGSFYTTNGAAVPSNGVGDGPPEGGVATWMDSDEYTVFAAFAKLTLNSFLLEAEFATARHVGTRNPEAVLALQEGGLNGRQREQFGLLADTPTVDDVNTNAEYSVTTAYGRAGYRFSAGSWTVTPYGQVDFFRNPETVQQKDFGGDNEAGLADDGEFIKSTIGLVLRPVVPVALKIDASMHTQTFNNETINYPEIRFSLSAYWELLSSL